MFESITIIYYKVTQFFQKYLNDSSLKHKEKTLIEKKLHVVKFKTVLIKNGKYNTSQN